MSKKTAAQERAERAAAALAEQRRKERRRTVLAILGVVVAMIVIVGGGFLISNRSGGGEPDAAAGSATGSSLGVAMGPADAPHSIVIHEDFLCPYCGALESVTRERLTALADQGKVRVEYRPFNLLQTDYSQHSLEVFQAVNHLGDAAVTKKLHDLLYENQPEETADSFPSRDDLVKLAVQAGADESAVRKSIDNGDATKWADAATKAADEANIRSTPTVFLDGKEFTGTTIQDLADSLVKAVS